MRRLTSAIELSDSARDQACQLFRSAQNQDLLRGRSIEAISAACLYKVGQEQGQWVTQSDVAETGNATPTTVRTHYETPDELAV